MKHLMWDIDGTLLTTAKAGYDALCKVVKDYYFLEAYDIGQKLAGRTDSDIIKSIIVNLRGRFVPAEAASLLIRYGMELPKQLPTHKGRVMKNVEITLAHFMQPGSKYENCLCTGNIQVGAKLKLAHYQVDKYVNYNLQKIVTSWLSMLCTEYIWRIAPPFPRILFSSGIRLMMCAVLKLLVLAA